MRSFGGSIGLAIAVIILNSRIRSSVPLEEALLPQQAAALYKSPLAIESFSPPLQALVATTYAEAFAQQMRVAAYVSALGFLLSLCTFEQNPFRAQGRPSGVRCTAPPGAPGAHGLPNGEASQSSIAEKKFAAQVSADAVGDHV